MEQAILDELSSSQQQSKKNRVRKAVCNKLDASWDTFFAAVQSLIEQKKIVENETADGNYITLADGVATTPLSVAPTAEPSAKARMKGFLINAPSSSGLPTVSRAEKIAVPIAIHLQKKGQQKLRNIEVTAKCKIYITGDCSEDNFGGNMCIYALYTLYTHCTHYTH